jgi:hypothetical protein
MFELSSDVTFFIGLLLIFGLVSLHAKQYLNVPHCFEHVMHLFELLKAVGFNNLFF